MDGAPAAEAAPGGSWEAVVWVWLHGLDTRWFFAVNGFAAHTGWLHRPMQWYAGYGVVVFAALLLVGLLHARHGSSRQLAAAGWAGLATMLAVAVNQPIVHLVAEARPYTTHPHVLLLTQRSADFSFPSDHAVMAGAVATGLLIAWRPLGLVAVAAAGLMAFARVYIAAHYPWDVVAGLAIGAAVAVLGWLLLRWALIPISGRLRRLPAVNSVFDPREPVVTTEPGRAAA